MDPKNISGTDYMNRRDDYEKELKWRARLQHFFGSIENEKGVQVDQLEAYENLRSNAERLEFIFHLPMVQVCVKQFMSGSIGI